MAERLSESLREGDTVARIGGDEFTVLLPEIDSEEAAAEVARKIQERLSAPFLVGEDEVHVTISIGAALYPSDGDDVESLSRNADGTMYRVKEEGGNGFQLCSRTSSSKALGRLSIEQQLRRALDHGEFVSYYQPIVDARTREITSLEALVRWRHPENIVIEPAGFISAAEYSGLIIPMGKVVLREACLQMKSWQDAGVPRMRLAVNVSARQLHQRDFTGMVERTLEETGLDPRSLELEITESVAMRKSDSITRLLSRLREMGIRIAMDDFGTGQSSLSYLKNFPIDTPEDRPLLRGRHRLARERRVDRDRDPRDGRAHRPAHRGRGSRDRGAVEIPGNARLPRDPGISLQPPSPGGGHREPLPERSFVRPRPVVSRAP